MTEQEQNLYNIINTLKINFEEKLKGKDNLIKDLNIELDYKNNLIHELKDALVNYEQIIKHLNQTIDNQIEQTEERGKE